MNMFTGNKRSRQTTTAATEQYKKNSVLLGHVDGGGGGGVQRNYRQENRTIGAQIASLSETERQCFDKLKSRWEMRHSNSGRDSCDDDDDDDTSTSNPLYTDEMILRFARCAPAGPFKVESAWKVMKKFNRRYLTLTARGLNTQLVTRTLFPLPGLETIEGNEVFYMRPSRYFPKNTSAQVVIDNLVYVMSAMNEKEHNVTNGIAFIANMEGWTMSNFSLDYCFQFMMKLQGSVPTRVTHFLIVNPPSWFGKIWTIMRKMLLPSFQRKVHMIRENKLRKYLKRGYQDFLPSEMTCGRAPIREIVEDFIDERRYREAYRGDGAVDRKISSSRQSVEKNKNRRLLMRKASIISDETEIMTDTDTTESFHMMDLNSISKQLGMEEPSLRLQFVSQRSIRSLRTTEMSS